MILSRRESQGDLLSKSQRHIHARARARTRTYIYIHKSVWSRDNIYVTYDLETEFIVSRFRHLRTRWTDSLASNRDVSHNGSFLDHSSFPSIVRTYILRYYAIHAESRPLKRNISDERSLRIIKIIPDRPGSSLISYSVRLI